MTRISAALVALLTCLPVAGFATEAPAEKDADAGPPDPRHLKDEVSLSTGTLTLGGKSLSYGAEAGILVVRQDPMDGDPPRRPEATSSGDKATAHGEKPPR
jgi:hypothetical protein